MFFVKVNLDLGGLSNINQTIAVVMNKEGCKCHTCVTNYFLTLASV